jgi:hypothetical protein
MSVTGFSVQQDGEFANFQILKKAVLASEARRKEEQRQRRMKMGLPEIEGKSLSPAQATSPELISTHCR